MDDNGSGIVFCRIRHHLPYVHLAIVADLEFFGHLDRRERRIRVDEKWQMPSCVEEEKRRSFFHITPHEGWFIANVVTNILKKSTSKCQQATDNRVDCDIGKKYDRLNQYWDGGRQKSIEE